MAFADDAVRIDLACGRDETGRWHGHYRVLVEAEVLRRVGLHPDQSSAAWIGPSPPAWWHAESERTRWRR